MFRRCGGLTSYILCLSAIWLATIAAATEFPCVCRGGAVTRYNGYHVASITTFDGAKFKMTTDQKTLVARSVPVEDIPEKCKFQFTLETDARLRTPLIRVDWVGFAFGIHPKNPDKYRRTIQFGRERGLVKRGLGAGGRNFGLPYSFNKRGTEVSIDYLSQNETHTAYRLTSATCDYEIDYFRDDVNLWDSFVLRLGGSYAGKVEGFCGTCDGKKGNDRRVWGEDETLPFSDDLFETIMRSYKYGKHQHDKQQQRLDELGIELGDPLPL